MPWTLTHDVESYADRVWELLAASPAEHTLALTVIDSVRAGRAGSADDAMVFGSYEDSGTVRGAVSMTPPFELLLTCVPAGTVDELVAALRARGVTVPGVNGDAAATERFAAAWTAGTGLRAATTMRQRLYRLEALRPPAPPEGRARLGDERDRDVALGWFRAFAAEAMGTTAAVEPMVAAGIAGQRLWLWESAAAGPVAIAGRTPTVAAIARIAPVYTPPEHRRRGYGAAVTAACTADALERGAGGVVLFTDLDNPTSNAIYQQIGFRPLADRRVVRFADAP